MRKSIKTAKFDKRRFETKKEAKFKQLNLQVKKKQTVKLTLDVEKVQVLEVCKNLNCAVAFFLNLSEYPNSI